MLNKKKIDTNQYLKEFEQLYFNSKAFNKGIKNTSINAKSPIEKDTLDKIILTVTNFISNHKNQIDSKNFIKIFLILKNYDINFKNIDPDSANCILSGFQNTKVEDLEVAYTLYLFAKINLPWNKLPENVRKIFLPAIKNKVSDFDNRELFYICYALPKFKLNHVLSNNFINSLLENISSKKDALDSIFIFVLFQAIIDFKLSWRDIPNALSESILKALTNEIPKFNRWNKVDLLYMFVRLKLTWNDLLELEYKIASDSAESILEKHLVMSIGDFDERDLTLSFESLNALNFLGFMNADFLIKKIINKVKDFEYMDNVETVLDAMVKFGVEWKDFPHEFQTGNLQGNLKKIKWAFDNSKKMQKNQQLSEDEQLLLDATTAYSNNEIIQGGFLGNFCSDYEEQNAANKICSGDMFGDNGRSIWALDYNDTLFKTNASLVTTAYSSSASVNNIKQINRNNHMNNASASSASKTVLFSQKTNANKSKQTSSSEPILVLELNSSALSSSGGNISINLNINTNQTHASNSANNNKIKGNKSYSRSYNKR